MRSGRGPSSPRRAWPGCSRHTPSTKKRPTGTGWSWSSTETRRSSMAIAVSTRASPPWCPSMWVPASPSPCCAIRIVGHGPWPRRSPRSSACTIPENDRASPGSPSVDGFDVDYDRLGRPGSIAGNEHVESRRHPPGQDPVDSGSHRGDEKEEPDRVGDEPWRHQKGTGYEDGGTVA